MPRINTFNIKLLQTNLSAGQGHQVSLGSKLKSLKLIIGPDSCPAKAAASVFAVNELPRLYLANQGIKFETAEDGTSRSGLQITFGDGSEKKVDLGDCQNSTQVFSRLLKEAE
ncbi:hypothetical protein HDV05_003769 [Chytridiales sp. JEL 0842]|nr:hypothetical protein HDV05_003769 [Chytridiales sp. JEL 0842]